MNDDKVIQAFPAAPANPLEIAPRNSVMYCAHNEIVLDEHEREVRCQTCAKVIDPFDYLLNRAGILRTAYAAYSETRKRHSEIAQRVHLLAKEEKRLRARVERLRSKEPTT